MLIRVLSADQFTQHWVTLNDAEQNWVLHQQKQKAKSQEINGDDEDLGLDEEHAESNTSESEWNKYMWKFDVLVSN